MGEFFSSAADAANPGLAPISQSAEYQQFSVAAKASNPSPRASADAPKERHSSLNLEVPGGARRVLLHVCCAPCCGAIVECLQENGIEPVIFFSNSNIYPLSEYEHRRAECERWAAARGVVFVEDEYDHAAWREAVLGLENEPERGRRCSACFRFRLFRAAQYAASHGLTVLTTSLASSRWKNLDQVNEAGESAVFETIESAPRCSALILGEVSPRPPQSLRSVGALRERFTVVEPVETPATVPSIGGFDRLNHRDHRNTLIWWPQNWRKGGLQERRGQIILEQNFYNQLYCGCEFSLATSPAIARQAAEPDSK